MWMFEIEQDGLIVASGFGPEEDCKREAMHYSIQYLEEGPIKVTVKPEELK